MIKLMSGPLTREQRAYIERNAQRTFTECLEDGGWVNGDAGEEPDESQGVLCLSDVGVLLEEQVRDLLAQHESPFDMHDFPAGYID